MIGDPQPHRSRWVARCWAITLLLLWTCLNVFAADAHGEDNPLDELRFESVGADSIPRHVVASMAQDKAGFLWIATGDGLVRYDGHHFRPQERASPDPTARNLGWIRAMLGGRDGRVWIGTSSDGLASYDPVSGRISLHRVDVAQDGGAEPVIVALAEDRDGSIWAGSIGGGLEHFDPRAAASTRYRAGEDAGALPDNRISALLVDRAGDLWIGSWAGLSRRRRGSRSFEAVRWRPPRSDSNPPSIVTALFQASDGRIWVGTQQGDLAVVDPAGNELQELQSPLPGRGSVSAFVETPTGEVWVGSATGIDLYDVHDQRLLRRLHHDPHNRSGLAGNEITSLMMDQAGTIWVGGFGLGLQRYNTNNRHIRVRGPDLRPGAALAEADFRSVLQLDNGEIWAATPKLGIVAMDRRLRFLGRIGAAGAFDAALHSPSPLRITAMTQAPDGSIWAGGPSRLMHFDRKRRLLRSIVHGEGETHALLATDDGDLWVGTQDGLHVLRRGAAMPQRIALRGGQALTGPVFALASAADGSLWVGGVAGLFHLDMKASELQAVTGLANPRVIGMLIDRDGALWIDTAVAGLHRMTSWDGRHATFDRISERHGVLNRPFGASLLQDRRGRIWSHMYVYDPQSDRLEELTPADGVSFGTGWFRACTKADDGRLLFGGSRGLLVVDAEPFDISDFEPRVVVSELRIDGVRQRSEYLGDGLQLGPEQRGFSVEFVALDFNHAARNRYAWRLQGFDARWMETDGNFRVASYSNLAPGEYRFRARATNRSGVWSSHELSFAVKILPAWWQLREVQLLALLVLLALLLGLVHWRTRQLRTGKAALEDKVRERTAELERVALALQHESAALEEASLIDPSSGLRNRRFLSRHIEADTSLAVRRHENHLQHGAWLADDVDLIFFLIDIDHFGQFRDLHGQAAAAAVVMQIRQRLQQISRSSDHLVRWSDEKFLVVARATSRASAARLAERMLAAITERAFELDDGRALQQSCSVGFCCFPLAPPYARSLDWGAAVDLADAALQAVSSAGRNGWLGLISARADSADELAAWLQRPLLEWWKSGYLDIVFSTAHSAWTEAPDEPRSGPARPL